MGLSLVSDTHRGEGMSPTDWSGGGGAAAFPFTFAHSLGAALSDPPASQPVCSSWAAARTASFCFLLLSRALPTRVLFPADAMLSLS